MASNGGTDAYGRVKGWLENPEMREVIERTLPKGTHVDGWIQAALTIVRTNEAIGHCEPLSILGSLMTAASIGLRLEGPLGQAYLTDQYVRDRGAPKGQRSGHYECQIQIGYRGLIALAYRDQAVLDIEATIVYQADIFEFQRGTAQHLMHTWNVAEEDRGPMVAVYSGVRFASGYYAFRVYSMRDVMDLRRKTLAQRNVFVEYRDGQEVFTRRYEDTGRVVDIDPLDRTAPTWIAHPLPMIQKSAIKWSSKYWRLAELDAASSLDTMADIGSSQGLAEAALEAMPEGMRRQVERDTGVASEPSKRTAAASMLVGRNLREQMLAEATRAAATAPAEPDPASAKEAPAKAAATGAAKAKGKAPAAAAPDPATTNAKETDEERAEREARETIEANHRVDLAREHAEANKGSSPAAPSPAAAVAEPFVDDSSKETDEERAEREALEAEGNGADEQPSEGVPAGATQPPSWEALQRAKADKARVGKGRAGKK